MVIEVQKACVIPEIAEGRKSVLGIGKLAMTPGADLEISAACCVTLALAAGTCAPSSISLMGRLANM
jgi:hypothetical protein